MKLTCFENAFSEMIYSQFSHSGFFPNISNCFGDNIPFIFTIFFWKCRQYYATLHTVELQRMEVNSPFSVPLNCSSPFHPVGPWNVITLWISSAVSWTSLVKLRLNSHSRYLRMSCLSLLALGLASMSDWCEFTHWTQHSSMHRILRVFKIQIKGRTMIITNGCIL